MSENKTGRYFKYAIGEIILVVIGILIALQINNWNENRKERQEEQRILVNLKHDIINDTLSLQKKTLSTVKRDSSLIEILDLLSNKENYNQKRFIELCISSVGYIDYFEVNSGTFDKSVASGSIKHVSNDSLRQRIFNYYRTTKLNYNDNVASKDDTSLDIMFDKVFVSKEVMSRFGVSSKVPKLNIDSLSRDVEFNRVLLKKLGNQSQQRISWSNYQKNAKKVLQSIDNELEQ